MNSPSAAARIGAVIGGAALIVMTLLVSSCSPSENHAPPTTTPTTTSPMSSSAPASPTEKGLSPSGGNKFSPTAVAPSAPTAAPGNHHHGLNGIG